MTNTPEQFVQIHKSAIDSLHAAALVSMEGFERLSELNIQAARASIDESTEAMKNLLEVRGTQGFAELTTNGAPPAAEKFAAYSKHVHEIVSSTNAQIAKLIEKQFADSNRQVYAAIDAMAQNAPAGTEGVVTLVKQVVSSANNAFDQAAKAGKQVAEMTQTNMNAAKNAQVRATDSAVDAVVAESNNSKKVA